MRLRLLLLLSCLVIPGLIQSQNCYKDYLQRGIQAYEDLDFENALNLFDAAKICPDITEEQIEEVIKWHDLASTGYIDAIKKARDEAIRAQEAAVMAKTEAENQANRKSSQATRRENANLSEKATEFR